MLFLTSLQTLVITTALNPAGRDAYFSAQEMTVVCCPLLTAVKACMSVYWACPEPISKPLTSLPENSHEGAWQVVARQT